MIVARTIAEARTALRELPRPLGFVPTMGALHAGHLSLVEAAGRRCASVAASVFVNPTQFGRGEDLSAYPRDEVRDLRLLEEAGVAVVFAPEADEMYPEGFATLVHVGGALTESFEGASRPSHFDGVAVIVTKLLGVTQPDVLFLGEKDAQQLAVVRRMVRDLDLPVEVAGVPTLREPDGLAMSSRNGTSRRRSASWRRTCTAPSLRARRPRRRRARTRRTSSPRRRTSSRRRSTLDYLAVVDADTFVQTAELGPRSVLVVAARLGSTRLIDNLSLAAPAAGEPLTTSSSSAYPAKDATA